MPVRLRPKNVFGDQPTKPESVDPASVYVISIASEGKTEEQYFDEIADMGTEKLLERTWSRTQ